MDDGLILGGVGIVGLVLCVVEATRVVDAAYDALKNLRV